MLLRLLPANLNPQDVFFNTSGHPKVEIRT